MNGEVVTIGFILTVVGMTWHYRVVTPVGLDGKREAKFRRTWPVGATLSILGLVISAIQSGSWMVLAMSLFPVLLIFAASSRSVEPADRDIARTSMFITGYVSAVVLSAIAPLLGA